MKKAIYLAISVLLVMLLAACSSAAETSEEPLKLSQDYPDASSVQAQLALGSLRLEETELAIDEGLAAELVPLWQAYQSLSDSETAAEAELTAIVNQIQDAMTLEQIEAIAAMELTAEDANAYLQEVGASFGRGAFGAGRFAGDQGGNNRSGGGFGGPSGGRPGGGDVVVFGVPGGGFGGPGGFGQLTEDERATRIAEFSEGDFAATFVERALIGSLVVSLQIKTGELDEEELQGRFSQAGRLFDTVLDVVSETTGIPVETLQAEVADGLSLAEIITANGGDLASVEDALKEALADLPGAPGQGADQQVEGLLNRSFPSQPASDGE